MADDGGRHDMSGRMVRYDRSAGREVFIYADLFAMPAYY